MGPGPGPAWQHLPCRPGRMGQLLHRELVPMAGHEDRRHDTWLAPPLAGGLTSSHILASPGRVPGLVVAAAAALALLLAPTSFAASPGDFSASDQYVETVP